MESNEPTKVIMGHRDISEKYIENYLTRRGYEKDVAGPDWYEVVRAIKDCADGKSVGLVFSGPVGTGKTIAAKAAMDILVAAHPDWNSAYMENENRDVLHIDCFSRASLENLESWNEKDFVMLDDLGADRSQREYGNLVDPVLEFVCKWYALCARGKSVALVATTNMDSERIAQRYDERFVDRILSSCKCVKFTGASRRKSISWVNNAHK